MAANVVRVNEVEEQSGYRSAVAEILRNIQCDHGVTLVEISAAVNVSLGTVSNAANKKTDLNPICLKRLGAAYGAHVLDPFAKLAGGRIVAMEAAGSHDVLPTLTLVSHRISTARCPESPGGVAETLHEQLGYLPDLRRVRREIDALIHRIEARKDAA